MIRKPFCLFALALATFTLAGCKPSSTKLERTKAPTTDQAVAAKPKFTATVTFKTATKAPDSFDRFTFFWAAPTVEPDTLMDYVVVQPDGKEYIKYNVSTVLSPGSSIRSDFFPGVNVSNVSVFFGQDIKVIVRVTKGDIRFDPNDKGYFLFTKEVQVPTDHTAPDASGTGRFLGNINNACTMTNIPPVYIVPTHETDKAAEQAIRNYVGKVRDRFAAGASVLTDEEALNKNLSANRIIAYGTFKGNSWVATNLAAHPVIMEQNRIVAGMDFDGTHLRFITAWPNPQNPQNALVVYSAQKAQDVVEINSVGHGPTDYVLAEGVNVLKAGDYEKRQRQWVFPVTGFMKTIDAIMDSK